MSALASAIVKASEGKNNFQAGAESVDVNSNEIIAQEIATAAVSQITCSLCL